MGKLYLGKKPGRLTETNMLAIEVQLVTVFKMESTIEKLVEKNIQQYIDKQKNIVDQKFFRSILN
ncbi:hypothetical protein [Liquorilactobacillus satsumensis]|uniref:Uncharacterized protein n=1 Tax=Liquorilactobacillus satsumensis DSM 16230 = JCM 12392 TaxID=1423801 RepID=A0A0R1V6S8_9LACO|nr:hypothetical protein [Liquorilactobacillus satsumensis]KRL99096.1 hypothetical protein FD50_GL000375 [Liquorilactobacillus satsumensis DSM 16230 = JCM 12392]MCP9329222.1 hypothetical protein [Liquorilactobacillus satsumensis]